MAYFYNFSPQREFRIIRTKRAPHDLRRTTSMQWVKVHSYAIWREILNCLKQLLFTKFTKTVSFQDFTISQESHGYYANAKAKNWQCKSRNFSTMAMSMYVCVCLLLLAWQWSAIFPTEQVTEQQSALFVKKLLAVAVS